MNLLLVRHGETAWNREGRYQGRTDIPLSPDGEAQVARLAQRLAGVTIELAIASPLSRARATAEAICAGKCTVELDEDLVEISHGAWEGQLASELERTHLEMLDRWRTSPGASVPAGPGAETLGDVDARAHRALAKLFARPFATALVVAHDAVNRVILCRALGLSLERVWKFRQAPAALNVLEGTSLEALAVVRMNDSDHSTPLVGGTTHRAL